MINDGIYALRNKIRELLSTEEWLVCYFSAIPNIFTEELLIWCLRDELSAEIINESISKLLKLGYIDKQYNKKKNHFFTMHDRFRKIMNNTEDVHYILFCKKLVNYYNEYISKNKEFSKQYYNDKLFYQLILNDNTEWRRCYQYVFEKGDYFENEKLLNIYQKALNPNNEILYAWYQYYKLQNKIINYNISQPEELDLDCSRINNTEFYVYWTNICGVLYFKYGKYRKAEKYFSNALASAKTDYELYVIQYNKCIVYLYTQQYMTAFKLLSQLCDNKSCDDLFFHIKCKMLQAIINMRIYKLDTALLEFEEVLNLQEKYQTQLRNSPPLYLCQKQPKPLCASIDKNIYNFIGEIYLIQGKFQQAIQYHLKGLQYNKTFGNTLGMAWANNGLGKTFYISGDTQTAKKYLEESISLFENSNDILSKAFPLMELSYVYQYNGDVEYTIDLLKESLLLLKQKRLVNDMLSSLNNLGRLYQSQGFFDVAKIIFDCCLSKFKGKSSVKQYLGWIYNNLARNYLYLKEYDKAIIHFNIAKNIFEEIHEKRGCIYVLNNIGETYAKQQKFDDALKLLIETCQKKEEMGDMHGTCYSYREIGELYLKLGQKEIAHFYINKALYLCELGNFIMLKGDILTSLGNYYLIEYHLEEAINLYLKALDNYKRQSFFGRSLICAQKINNILQEYNYTNITQIDEQSIYNKLKRDQIILIQELQELLNDIFD